MKDIIKDTDTHFIIDGSTRLVKNDTDTKSMLVQYDHNSERFTFRLPRKFDEHDLSLCNCVRVHFINIDKSKRAENHGIDDITDTLDICPEDDEFVICSWLITRDATQLAGSLHFVIQFAVKEGDTIKYSWNTAKYTGITIQDGINFDEKTVSENNDLLTQWENRLKASQIVRVEQTVFSDESEGENVWTATFGDGSTSELKVKNGSRGETGYVGSIQTIDGNILNFFVGTKEQYNDLPVETQQNNLFAIISDDTAQEDFFKLVGGKQITSGDLDDYYQVGNYYIEGVTDTPNVSNLPIKTAGVLKVISGNGATFNDNSEWFCIIQMFIAHSTGDMYIRGMIHNSTGNHWRDWQQVAILGNTLDRGVSPDEASLIFTNTNGFGTPNNKEKGFWRVWDYADSDNSGETYCRIIPSLDNKQCLGRDRNRIKEAYISQVHGKADKAGHADTAGCISALPNTIVAKQGVADITLEANSIYVFNYISAGPTTTYTLYIGANSWATSTCSNATNAYYLVYKDGKLSVYTKSLAVCGDDINLSYVKLASAVPEF